jgi:hypothetical protein
MMLNSLMAPLEYEHNPQMYYDLMSAVNTCVGRSSKTKLYQYGDLYLTLYKWRAENFAKKAYAGGEFALAVYRLYRCAIKIGFDNWHPNKDQQEAINTVTSFAESVPAPVVFEFHNLDPKMLMAENGLEIPIDMIGDIPNVRYKGKMVLDIKNANYI